MPADESVWSFLVVECPSCKKEATVCGVLIHAETLQLRPIAVCTNDECECAASHDLLVCIARARRKKTAVVRMPEPRADDAWKKVTVVMPSSIN